MASAEPSYLAIVGPTASGKTEAGVAVAERLDAEIVSVDSTSVYRGMDIGTAKPRAELRARVPHHLIDVADPSEGFAVARFQELASEAVGAIRGRGHRVLLVGGSGLYFRAVVDDLTFPPTDPRIREALEREAELVGSQALYERLATSDPEAAGKIEPDNVRRTVRALEVIELTGRSFSSFAQTWDRYPEGRIRAAGIDLPRAVLHRRIEGRVREQVANGLVEEVRELVDRGFAGWLTSSQAIGYAEVARHLQGEFDLQEAIALTSKRTKALARRQLAWFRRDPRIRWFEAEQAGAAGLVDDLTEYLRD
ncbi:MAG TPA: tRNA (adenosine(37)-N6)-dimethylallyltransferase MiaA [Actinomycetota bacterium]|jgi:tRNA dimethylallyltransferase|nr:tRNA (adenosine(37)-N6)-dimethylallyltransferase MiaA [Actinomycetota bacterium]